jgi:hypothetical protein
MACPARQHIDRARWPTPSARGSFGFGFAVLRNKLLATFFALIFWTLTSPSGMATPLNAWEHRCVEEDDSQARICSTEIVLQYRGRDFVLYFARGPAGPVPFIAQSEGADFRRMVMTVDGKDILEADRCEAGMCFYEAGKSHKLIRLFRKGNTAHVLIEGVGGEVLISEELTLAGFTAAYRRYR